MRNVILSDIDQYAYMIMDSKVSDLLSEDIDKLLQNPDS